MTPEQKRWVESKKRLGRLASMANESDKQDVSKYKVVDWKEDIYGLGVFFVIAVTNYINGKPRREDDVKYEEVYKAYPKALLPRGKRTDNRGRPKGSESSEKKFTHAHGRVNEMRKEPYGVANTFGWGDRYNHGW